MTKRNKQQYDYLLSNLPLIEVCLFINELKIADFALYLQYGIKFEQSNNVFKKLYRNSEFQSKLFRGNPKENLIIMKHMMNNILDYIRLIDKNRNNASIVYKDTIESCNNILDYINSKLDKER